MNLKEIKWAEFTDTIKDAIYSCLEIDADEVEDALIRYCGFTREEAAQIADEIYGKVMDYEEYARSDLSYEITNDVANIIRDREEKITYPEDAPGQMHLFELEDSKDE